MNKLENQTNLINRLYAKFHNTNIFKRIIGLTMASAIALISVGCDSSNFPQVGTGSSTNTNKSEITSGYSESKTNGTSSNNSENPKDQYSDLLLNVLNDEYYNSIISKAKNGNEELYNHGIFKPHPYAFLEDEGYNIDDIKNKKLYCTTYSFTNEDNPNSLYICTTVETSESSGYYTIYLLEYKLTEQEMKDYNMLHSGFYIQSFFLNNEISALKEPTILKEARITPFAHENLYLALQKSKQAKPLLNNNEIGGAHLLSFDVNNGTFEVLVTTPLSTERTMVSRCYLNVLKLKNFAFNVAADENGAFLRPSEFNTFGWQENQNKAILITLYQPITNSIKKTNILSDN